MLHCELEKNCDGTLKLSVSLSLSLLRLPSGARGVRSPLAIKAPQCSWGFREDCDKQYN